MNKAQKREIEARDLHPAVFDLFDEYVHSTLSRREFLEKLSKYAIAGMTAATIYEFLAPKYAEATQIQPTDPRLESNYIEYNSPRGAGIMKGLLSRPALGAGRYPGIVVVHENRGLNPHIEDVARRVAIEGYIALAPDALTPFGGYPGSDEEGKMMQRKRNRGEMLEDFIAAFEHLKNHHQCSGKIGVVGFCFGGSISNQMAIHLPDLAASVPFYGGQPKVQDVPKIQAPLLLHYAELDARINKGWPQYEAALKANNKEYTAHLYTGVRHGFHNDTTPRYNKEAAELAWKRTVDFFNAKLS